MDRKTAVNLLGAILGISLLVVFALALSGWFRTMRQVRESAPVSPPSQPASAPQESEGQIPPTPQSPEQADPTAGWNVYNNDEYRYTIKYPPNFIVKESPPWGNRVHSIGIYDSKYESVFDPQHPGIGMAIFQADEKESLKEWFERHATTVPFGSTQDASLQFFGVKELKETTILNHSALGFVEEPMGIKSYTTLIKRDSYIMAINYTHLENKELRDIYSLTLSTLELQ